MDLSPTEDQRELVALAARILSDATAPEVLHQRDREGVTTFDRALWRSLADAGLLGVGVPEDHGGLGFGFLETCLLLEQVGRRAAPVPALAVLGAAVPLLAEFGTPEQKAAVLEPACQGSVVPTVALTEIGGDPYQPSTTATPDGDGWVLNGEKSGVPGGTEADVFLVSASVTGLGPRLFVIPAGTPGVEVEPQPMVTGEVDALLRFAGVRLAADSILGSRQDDDVVAFAVRHATTAMCAVVAGAGGAAVELTAAYVKTREAFQRPLATFQAVGQRLADAFTAAWTVRLTALEAAWSLADGRTAEMEVMTAKYYASAAGLEVARATHHLHGGFGVDRAYPLHRLSMYSKRIELTFGGAGEQIERLGDRIAAETVAS